MSTLVQCGLTICQDNSPGLFSRSARDPSFLANLDLPVFSPARRIANNSPRMNTVNTVGLLVDFEIDTRKSALDDGKGFSPQSNACVRGFGGVAAVIRLYSQTSATMLPVGPLT